MKTPSIFAVTAALVVAATSVGLSARAQGETQKPAPAAATTTPADAATVTAQPGPAAAAVSTATPAQPGAPIGDAKLTAEESTQAVEILTTKCTRCHGTEPIEAQRLDKAGWQEVLGSMGPAAELSKAETALALRYLVENLGPAPKA